ncbi:Neprosin activation peptide [Arabidopsis thaliana x Arabidopsis arenosa]|uniref:Neprosin activation peptide n=1 Tax=Arabidopsis thaliana x Arabidopsis arenosa TaxID=1240361 RepID=A0A8T1YYG4_9BRAS|nr:Neprosin activation peptide [Arabidopsis thaliana x Arabidopsis arenosa]
MEVIVLASKRSLLLFLLIVSLSLSQKVIHISAFNDSKPYRQVSSLRLARIQKHLNRINKSPVFTIQSPDGDVIDCIPKRKQPALDHPLLKHHKIQKAPKKMPKMKGKDDDVKEAENVLEGAWQMWHVNGTRCPKGTVPIRRNTMNDVLRAKSLFDFGKKRRSIDLDRQTEKPDALGTNGHEHAIAYTETSSEIYGAKATINVWDPKIEEVNEFSLSQIWILSGSFVGPDLNSIEAGWQVSPELYGDNRPRLFTYWTSDSYQATGCYNLLCSGFIQTNNKIAIGAAISPLSTFKGNQFDITILIWKDPKMGNWWMGLGDSTLVGYWPAELFTHLADHATTVEWGGEVVNTRASGRHTTTQMGSGHFPDEGFGKASYFRNLEVVDSDNSLVPVRDVKILAENTECYDIKSSHSNEWGTYFYYGGPGFNPRCS